MDAKKKRNKKKKGNQTKNGDETISHTEEHGNASAVAERNQNGKVIVSSQGAPLSEHEKESDKQQVTENGDVGSKAPLSEQDKESKKQPFHNGLVSVNSAVPRVMLPERLEEMDKHNMCEEKLVKLHETITKLEEERNSWLKKVTSLEDRLSKMQDKVDTYVQNELSLEDKISKVQNKVDMSSQNEVHLGRNLQILQDENDMLAKKQVSLEDKFERIEDMKYSWSLKEGSLNATITWLEEVNRVLQMRVKALEQSTNNTDQENRKLIESLSLVESRIEALEAKSVQGSLSAEVTKIIEEESPMIITQPANTQTNQHSSHFVDPPKMVNELDIKPKETVKGLSKSDLSQERRLDMSSPSVQTIQENSENLLRAVQVMQHPGTVPVNADSSNDTTITVDIDQVQKLELHLPSLSEETMHPLQAVEINEEEVASSDEKTEGVPISDAPLIGAPFRLFSFVAKFVAGSDLVN
ncbi:hyaluronan mediated motility receptor-like protein [Carex littledalei]|uniref:Hyaluronan mediated motility receptor-like protein n=1 Tax=Carex littledalei TaxID=544730 RepID=A0A833R2P8_9POAL|nr:hyaluronan mediated motility receptor-like protein [Carex littledalei]